MSVVVGYGPEARGNGALALARLLAESASEPLVVCCVLPDRWEPVSIARSSDAEFDAHLSGLARHALDVARAALAGCDGVTYEVVRARSGPAGLVDAVERHGARYLVTGSSGDGAWGHIALGSVTDRLLHSSPVPVAVATRGLRYAPGTRIGRITVALDGTAASREILAEAADLAASVGGTLRIVSFGVRAGEMYPPEAGLRVEERVADAWRVQVEAAIADAVAAVPSASGMRPGIVLAEGASWGEALDVPDWHPGDMLVIGSSSGQRLLSRVFLGSTAARIVRHSPVPVLVTG